jgi:hypothetical protein
MYTTSRGGRMALTSQQKELILKLLASNAQKSELVTEITKK